MTTLRTIEMVLNTETSREVLTGFSYQSG